MYIDIKKEIWERIYIPKDLESELKDRFNNEPLESIIDDVLCEDVESEEIYETEHILTPEENNGNSTIEVYEKIGKCIYSNSSKN